MPAARRACIGQACNAHWVLPGLHRPVESLKGTGQVTVACLKRSIWDFAPGDLMERPHSHAPPAASAHSPSGAAENSPTAW